MKLRIAIIIASLWCALGAAANTFSPETLHYKVMFKWGLINKKAGTVAINIGHHPEGGYASRLTAASAPWADKFYRVRDTLQCRMSLDLKPSLYEKFSHEGKEDKVDRVVYSRSGYRVTAKCTRKKWKSGKLTVNEQRDLAAEGTTVDMLTAFYYMRALPFPTWKPGHVLTINIFSGKRKELLTIKYLGNEAVEGKDCYHISFIFTSDGRTRTSDDMEAWISTDAERIPLKLEGKLPVGKVKCYYTGKS